MTDWYHFMVEIGDVTFGVSLVPKLVDARDGTIKNAMFRSQDHPAIQQKPKYWGRE